MTQKSPSYQWYPKDAISSARIAVMTLEQEGAYRRALDYCWLTGSLPADLDMLARIIGKGCTTETATVVRSMFTRDRSNKKLLTHDRLDMERSKQKAWREKSAAGGRRGAATRWGADHVEEKESSTIPPAAKTKAKQRTSALLLTLHKEQTEEMLAGKFAALKRDDVMKKLDEDFPAGYDWRDDRHVFNAFRQTATALLKAQTKPSRNKATIPDPMSLMRKLN